MTNHVLMSQRNLLFPVLILAFHSTLFSCISETDIVGGDTQRLEKMSASDAEHPESEKANTPANLDTLSPDLDFLKQRINQNLRLLAVHGENTTEIDFSATRNQAETDLLSYLRQELLHPEDSIQNLDIVTSADGQVRLYVFGFHSGGTRGTVHNAIIQWKKSDGNFSVYAMKHYEMSFYSIDRLPSESTLYLLQGSETANSNLNIEMALVIQFKNDYLILDYPAFFNKSPDLLCIDNWSSGDFADMNYDGGNQTLTFSDLDKNDRIGIMEKEASGNMLVKLEGGIKRFVFQFDGKKFVLK